MATNLPSANEEYCPNCGEWFALEKFDSYTGWCNSCAGVVKNQLELFYQRNADHIEHYLLEGIGLRLAILKVRADIRPICVVCGNEIKYANKSAVFCRNNTSCCYYARRYKYLYTSKGLTKSQALAQIMQELTGE